MVLYPYIIKCDSYFINGRPNPERESFRRLLPVTGKQFIFIPNRHEQLKQELTQLDSVV